MNMEPGHVLPEMYTDVHKILNSRFLHQRRHDIRSAMHVVTGMSEVLSLSGSLPEREKEVVTTILRNAGRAVSLMDGVFDVLEQVKIPDITTSSRRFVYPERRRADGDTGADPLGAEELPAKSRVLVVEDDESNAFVVSIFLEELKYDFEVVARGEEALEKFAAGHYELIIMDLQLPGMDGLETVRRMRAIEKGKSLVPTPILASTANATKDDALFCLKAGMTDYISKPFSRRELQEKLLCALPLFRKHFC